MQEKAAGRNPEQVAKLGGVVQYDTGGVNINLEEIMNQYPTYSEEIYNPNILTEQLPQYQNHHLLIEIL